MRIAVPCPICEKNLIDDAREAWFVYGLILATRYGSKTFIGCSGCVRGKVIENLVTVAAIGWWSFWGVFATPFVLLQNLVLLIGGADLGLLRRALDRAGLDIEDLEVDAFGRTKEQVLIANAVLDVLAEAIWADGTADHDEVRQGVAIAKRLLPDDFSAEEIEGRLGRRVVADIPEALRKSADRVVVFRAAAVLVAADGRVTREEVAFLLDLGQRLALPRATIDEVLRDLGVERDPRARPRTAPVEHLMRAAAILGVAHEARQKDAKLAYRRKAMQHHPDRAGNDPEAIRMANAKMAELNWAYEQFATRGAL